jgi:uncharacterized repeat protein (TIGR02543 family)
MRKLLTLVLALFLFGFAVISATEVKASGTLSATITGIFEGSESFSLTPTGLTLGSNVSFDLNGKPSGQEFAFWIVNGIVRKDLQPNHSFPVTGRMQLQVVFAPTGKYAVVFINSSGQYLGVRYAGSNNSFTVDPSGINIPVKPGFELKAIENRWLSIEGSTGFSGVNEHSVFVVQYNPSTTFDDVAITVNNGSISGSYTFNSILTVTANAPTEGQFFAGWIENDILVSYDSEYTFTVLFPRTLTAIYDSEAPVVQPIVHISNDLELRSGYHTFIGQFEIPAGYTLLEYGFLAHADALILEYNTQGVVIAQSGSASVQNEFVTSFPIGQFYSFVAYINVINTSTSLVETFISDVNHRFIEEMYNLVDFESGTQGAYLRNVVSKLGNATGIDWFIETASSSNSGMLWSYSGSADTNITSAQGTNVGRIDGRNLTSVYNNDYINYVTRVVFDAKVYGTTSGVLKVYKQVSGGDWVLVATPAITQTFQTFSYDIDLANVRVKFEASVERVNIDNIKLYTVYNGEVYDVSIQKNNGSSIEQTLVRDGGLLTQPQTPTKSGYDFVGWYSNAELTNLHNFSEQVTGNFTIYAKWTPTNNTITYNLDGGTNDGANPSSYTIESSTISLQPATKDYYTFNGWYSNPGFTGSPVTQITSGSTTNVVLYAKFTPISYSITYNLDGGTNNESNPISYDVEDSLSFFAATKDGYTFNGWYNNAEYNGSAITGITLGSTGNLVLYAKFTENSGATYSVFFYDGATLLDEVLVAEGNLVEPMDPAPTKTGYTFNSWVTTNGGSTPFVFANPITQETLIYAKWDLVNYTITYNLNGGTNGANPSTYTILTSNITLLNATKANNTFDGWYEDSGFTVPISNIAQGSTGNKTLYAKFTPVGTLMIYEVYGAGGNAGATLRNDYVVLYNGTNSTINLVGYSLQYASATGTSWSSKLNLSGSIESGKYYLILLASGGSNGTVISYTANATGSISMAATAGKVALVNSTTELSGANPSAHSSVVDFVGFGTTANGYEGSGPTPAPSATLSVQRKTLFDNNNNATDFATVTPTLSYLTANQTP